MLNLVTWCTFFDGLDEYGTLAADGQAVAALVFRDVRQLLLIVGRCNNTQTGCNTSQTGCNTSKPGAACAHIFSVNFALCSVQQKVARCNAKQRHLPSPCLNRLAGMTSSLSFLAPSCFTMSLAFSFARLPNLQDTSVCVCGYHRIRHVSTSCGIISGAGRDAKLGAYGVQF